MENIWWDGHDPRTRAYFFWKWEYDRRNKRYCCDYVRAISTGAPSTEYFYKIYKHVHLDPKEGQNIIDILSAALMSNEYCPFDPYPPDDLYLDEVGGDGHHNEKDTIHFIISDDGLLFNISPNIDLATHKKILDDNFKEMLEEWRLFPGGPPRRIFPLGGLRRLYIPKGYRQRDNHRARAIGLALYDLKLKGLSLSQSAHYLTEHFEHCDITDSDEKTYQRYLRGTEACVNKHEVLTLT